MIPRAVGSGTLSRGKTMPVCRNPAPCGRTAFPPTASHEPSALTANAFKTPSSPGPIGIRKVADASIVKSPEVGVAPPDADDLVPAGFVESRALRTERHRGDGT